MGHDLVFLSFTNKTLASNKNLVGKDYWEHDKYLNIQLTGYFLQYLLYKTCLSDSLNDFLMGSDSWDYNSLFERNNLYHIIQQNCDVNKFEN